MPKPLADVKCILLHETYEAMLLQSTTTGKSAWVPKSLVEWDKDTSEATMPEWLAMEKELI